MPKVENQGESSTTKPSKHRFGKRLSKLLSNMLWHFNRSPPDFSTSDKRRSASHSSSAKRSKSMGEKGATPARRLRTNSIRNRTSTLMSIEEENEADEIPCK